MNRLESMAEKRLREAIENGEFDDLPGKGEPIDLKENPFEDPDLRVVHRLKTTGVALLRQARMLLTPAESGGEFQRKYFVAMQQSPEVVLAHSEFANLLGPARLSKEIH